MSADRIRRPDGAADLPPRVARARTRDLSRRVLLVAFTTAVAVHAAVLALRFQSTTPDSGPARQIPHAGGAATRVIDIVAVPVQRDAADPTSPRPSPLRRPAVSTPPVGAGDRADVATGAVDDPSGLLDRIVPRSTDARLFGRTNSALEPAVDRMDATRSRISDGIDRLNDSTAAAAEAERKRTDWTREDADGNLWGITPGTIHLGTTRMNLCGGKFDPADCGFVPPPGQRELMKARIGSFNAIRMQGQRADVDQAIAERARAIRARTAARRDTTRTSP